MARAPHGAITLWHQLWLALTVASPDNQPRRSNLRSTCKEDRSSSFILHATRRQLTVSSMMLCDPDPVTTRGAPSRDAKTIDHPPLACMVIFFVYARPTTVSRHMTSGEFISLTSRCHTIYVALPLPPTVDSHGVQSGRSRAVDDGCGVGYGGGHSAQRGQKQPE